MTLLDIALILTACIASAKALIELDKYAHKQRQKARGAVASIFPDLDEQEAQALRRGNTQAVHQARQERRERLHKALRGAR